MELKPGDIGFVIHKDNWISKTIAWFMGSKWSHTAIILHPTDKRTYTIETSDFQVSIQIFEDYLKDTNIKMEIWSPSLTDEERKIITNKALSHLGEIYGYLQLIS